MFTSTPLSLLSFIMESVQQLDPTLLAFWEGFPCPPPWKEELLFRLNWTGCVGTEVGEKVKLYMADKCNIRHDGMRVLPDPEEGDDGVMVEEECALTCQLIIGVVCVLFLVLLLVIVVFCVRRHKAKPASPSHPLTAHPDNTKYYTSCHYACAPVVQRQLQTTMNGERPETSVVPPGANTANGHYHPGHYPQHSCQQINYHQPHHHQLQQQSRIINTPYGQVPAHTSTLVVPQHPRYGSSHYRKLDGAYSTSSVSNSDRSPVYESIGDTDSIRERSRGGRDASMSECEFCECGGDHSSHDGGYVGYHDPSMLSDHPGHGDVFMDKLGHHSVRGYHEPGSQEDPPDPCPPMCMDGYYGDKCPQTLPLRPMRAHARREAGNTLDYQDFEADELSPLNRKNSSNQKDDDSRGQSEGSTRRRPSSSSCYSTNSSHYKEGNYTGQRRAIPALHPHYFVASPDEIS